VPQNVRFFSIDFEKENLAASLRHAPLDCDKPIFVSWLGVMQYLTRNAVGETLRSLASWSAGTEIALTYIVDDWSWMEVDEGIGMELTEARAAASGEPRGSQNSLRAQLPICSQNRGFLASSR
jgi:O-methyltransferase involved in polyketide biosynthesis